MPLPRPRDHRDCRDRRERCDSSGPRTRGRRRARLLERSWFLLAGTATMLCLALLVPLPGLSYSLMLGPWGLDWALALLLAALTALVRAWRRPDRLRVLSATLLAACLIVTAGVGAVQVRFAREHETSLSWWALTGINQPGRAPDVQSAFMSDEVSGQLLQAGIWLPRDGAGHTLQQSDGVPVVVLLHGGGWRTGNRLNPMTRGQAAWFADQGYLAVALDYPLSKPDLPTWDLAEDRAACGLIWTVEHAAQYGGDGQRLTLVGDSAGGNLALEIVLRQAQGSMSTSCTGTVPVPDVVSVTYPIADPVSFYDNPDLVMAPFTRARARTYTGGTPSTVAQRYDAVSPLARARSLSAAQARSLPPVLLLHGEQDHVVPAGGTQALDEALGAAGARHETVLVPYADHVLDLNPGSLASQVWRQETVSLMDQEGLAVR